MSEQLFYMNDKLKEHINDTFMSTSDIGTHVVTGIVWGANFIVKATDSKYDAKKERLIKGELKAKLTKINKALELDGKSLTTNHYTIHYD